MHFIETLKEGERVSEVYLCKTKQIAKTKAGKTYYSLVLQDRTGQLSAKVWEVNNGISHFEAMDYIRVDGEVTVFAGALQLNVRRIRVADPGEYVTGDYLPVSAYNVEEMYRELLSYIDSLKNEKLKSLADAFFRKDPDFIKSFKEHSAAKTVHHGFVGGLLEHTLGVVRLCDYLSVHYPALNRDLLLSAAMFHDIGKTKELSLFPENDYTDDGQLLGHIVMGMEMVSRKIDTIPGFPARTASELKHCILAHHGEYEYGSPKKPALMEALALNLADNMDAKLEMMRELLSPAQNNDWLGFSKLLDSNLRRTVTPKSPEEERTSQRQESMDDAVERLRSIWK